MSLTNLFARAIVVGLVGAKNAARTHQRLMAMEGAARLSKDQQVLGVYARSIEIHGNIVSGVIGEQFSSLGVELPPGGTSTSPEFFSQFDEGERVLAGTVLAVNQMCAMMEDAGQHLLSKSVKAWIKQQAWKMPKSLRLENLTYLHPDYPELGDVLRLVIYSGLKRLQAWGFGHATWEDVKENECLRAMMDVNDEGESLECVTRVRKRRSKKRQDTPLDGETIDAIIERIEDKKTTVAIKAAPRG